MRTKVEIRIHWHEPIYIKWKEAMSASEFSKVYKVVEKETGEIYSAEISSMKINKFSPNEFQNLKWS